MSDTLTPKSRPYYNCYVCNEEILLERTSAIAPSVDDGRVDIWYGCPCSPEELVGNVVFSHIYMRRLFGGKIPLLPWRSEMKWCADMGQHEGDLRLWAWEVEQLADSDELLDFFRWFPPAFVE